MPARLRRSRPAAAWVAPQSAGRETLILLGGKLLSNAALLALSVISARELGPDGRGVVVVVSTIAILTALASGLGVPSAFRVRLARSDEHVSLDGYLGLGLVLLAGQVLVCTGVAAVVLPRAGYDPSPGHYLLVGALGVSMLAASILYEALLAIGRSAAMAVMDAIGSVAALGLYLVWRAVDLGNVRFVIISMILGYVVAGVGSVGVLVRSRRVRVHVRGAMWRDLVRSGRAPLGQGLAQFTVYRVDRLVIGLSYSSRSVGLYSVAATCSEFVRLLPMAAGQVLLSRIADGRLDRRRSRQAALAVTGAVAAALGAVALAAPTIVRVVFGEQYAGVSEVIRLLALAELAMAVYLLATHLLMGQGRLGDAAAPALLGAVAIVVLDVALVPTFAIKGAAVAAVVAYTLMAADALRRLRRDGMAVTALEPIATGVGPDAVPPTAVAPAPGP